MTQIGLIVAVAASTYVTRIAGFLAGDRTIPPFVRRFLDYVPISVFAALVAPDSGIGTPQMAPRLVGLIVAGIVVLQWRQLWAGLAAGMAAYWLARFAL